MIGDTLDELKARIAASMDVTEFMDMLGIELVDVLDRFEEEIEEAFARFDRACR